MSSPCRLPVSTVRSTDTPNLGPQSPNQCVPETGNTEQGRDLTSSPAMAPQFRVLLLMKAEPRALGSLPVLSHPPSALWVLPTGLLPLPGLQLSQVRPPVITECYTRAPPGEPWLAFLALAPISTPLLVLSMFPLFLPEVVSQEARALTLTQFWSLTSCGQTYQRLAACPDFQELLAPNSQGALLTFWHNLPLDLEHGVPTI